MQPKTPKLLEDIRDAAAFTREVTRGKTLDDYRRKRLLRQAMERNYRPMAAIVATLIEWGLGES